MTRRKRTVFLGILVLGVAVIAVGLYLFVPSRRIAWEACQPKAINYHSFGPYCVGLLEDQTVWEEEYVRQRRYQLAICRDGNRYTYGRFIDVSFAFASDASDNAIAASRVEWSPEGLTFVTKSGFRLFVPKDAFIGGR